jgi:hypothetical protein
VSQKKLIVASPTAHCPGFGACLTIFLDFNEANWRFVCEQNSEAFAGGGLISLALLFSRQMSKTDGTTIGHASEWLPTMGSEASRMSFSH